MHSLVSHIKKTQSNVVSHFTYKNGFAIFGCWSLKFSKQLESTFAAFLSSGFGPQRLNFSIVECWWRMANRLTWTGIGTTILLPPFDDDPRLPMLCDVRPALTRFHFARRFWNQIFIWKWRVEGGLDSRDYLHNSPELHWVSASLQSGFVRSNSDTS